MNMKTVADLTPMQKMDLAETVRVVVSNAASRYALKKPPFVVIFPADNGDHLKVIANAQLEQTVPALRALCEEIEKKFPGVRSATSAPDWRIGLACTPKMRTHQYYGRVGIIRQIFKETPNLKEHMRIDMPTNDAYVFHSLDELSDDWMTA